MKICPKCHIQKELDAFSFRVQAQGTRQPWCKACMKAANAKHYINAREVYRTRAKLTKAALTEIRNDFLWTYLSSHPCVDCGLDDPIVLEFDHVKGKKVGTVPNLILGGHSMEEVRAEIEKCEVRCANCHKRATYTRAGSWRATYAGVADRDAAASKTVP